MSKPSEAVITIRRAKLADLAILQQLGTELMQSDRRFDPLFKEDWYFSEPGKKYFLKKIRGRNHVCLVAEVEGQIVGYVTGSVNTTETWRPVKRSELGNMYVREAYRRHGVGHHLFADFKKWSQRKGVSKMMVYVTHANTDATGFYDKVDFTPKQLIMEADL
jgi:ribosomal protein S18 acetylase RimI-like enzyme